MNRKCANLEVDALALGILQKFGNTCHRVEMRKAVTSSPNFQCCLRIDFTHLRACDRFQNLRVTRWSHAHAKKKQSNDCQNKTHIKILQQGTQALFILSVAHLRSQTRGLLSAPRLHTNFPLCVECANGTDLFKDMCKPSFIWSISHISDSTLLRSHPVLSYAGVQHFGAGRCVPQVLARILAPDLRKHLKVKHKC